MPLFLTPLIQPKPAGRSVAEAFLRDVVGRPGLMFNPMPRRSIGELVREDLPLEAFECWDTKGSLYIEVEPRSRRITFFSDQDKSDSLARSRANGLHQTVDRDKALASARKYLRLARAEPGDWHLGEMRNPFGTWYLRFLRYYRGYRCFLDFAEIRVSALDSSLVSLITCHSAVYPSRVGPLISTSIARARACDAWKQAGYSLLSPPHHVGGAPAWEQIARRQRLCRLAHTFSFGYLHEGMQHTIEILVDAETGEIWQTNSTRFHNSNRLTGSPRVALLEALLDSGAPAAITSALAAGVAVDGSASERVGTSIAISDGEGAGAIQWGRDGVTLHWRRATGPWSAVQVPPVEAAALKRWIASRSPRI